MGKLKVEPSYIERPLDFLNQCKGKDILIALENGNQIAGTLLAFDIHINLIVQTLEGIKFIRGDNVVIVS